MANPLLTSHEEMVESIHAHQLSRRRFVGRAAATLGSCGLISGLAQLEAFAQEAESANASKAVIPGRSSLKITKLETFIHRNSWVFVKISTDAGLVGWGEMLKDKSKACAAEAQEMVKYLVGQDPRPITHDWHGEARPARQLRRQQRAAPLGACRRQWSPRDRVRQRGTVRTT